MTKYSTLVNILDTIINDAPAKFKKRYPESFADEEQRNQARARAFIHLYLMVSFGLLDFEEREYYITDGPHDGGVDGYYINNENRTVYLIQSKFRINKNNFENKKISLEELLSMDVERIIKGESLDESNYEYNGKIRQFQDNITKTEQIARYSFTVIILANLGDINSFSLKRLTGGVACEVFNFESCYKKLVLPVLTGTYFNASDLTINIDLSNKNAGSKIGYEVLTRKGKCEITVLFVPVLEIAKTMYKYKNSILKYNPRSYLGHEGQNVNKSIKATIIQKNTNEFALFNNGITMLSDETKISEQVGQKNKAQLIVKNPQIINGGQTSFTLSLLYDEYILSGKQIDVFDNKEVLLKVITLVDSVDDDSKIELINEISDATNKQTPVIGADRISNDDLQLKIQNILFDKYGLLYERKRGEFADGVSNHYINEDDIMERNLFFRMLFASNGQVLKARQKRLFVNQKMSLDEIDSGGNLDNMYFGFLCFKKLINAKFPNQRLEVAAYAKIFLMVSVFKPARLEDYDWAVDTAFNRINEEWKQFMDYYKEKIALERTRRDKKTGETISYKHYDYGGWFNSKKFASDAISFFNR